MLGRTVKEEDFGVTISADQNVYENCVIAVSKLNHIQRITMRHMKHIRRNRANYSHVQING